MNDLMILAANWWEPGQNGVLDVGDISAMFMFFLAVVGAVTALSRWWLKQLRTMIREEVEELLNTGVIQQPADFPVLDGWANRYLAQFHFVLQSFPVEDSFDLRVKARTESEELEGTALRIRVAEPQAELLR